MNYHIVSEGVETQEEMEQISSWGVDMIQGYYFSKPLPEQEFVAYIENCKQEGRLGPAQL